MIRLMIVAKSKQLVYINNIIYVWKLNQTVLELDFRAVKFLFQLDFAFKKNNG
jgi:hypothetical protein